MINFQIASKRPLLDLSFASLLLDCRRENLLEMIEDGRIAWAWNLASGNGRPLIRVLAQNLSELVSGNMDWRISQSLEFNEVLRQIFPREGRTIRAGELAISWSITSDHVLKLWRTGLIQAERNSICRPGPGGSPMFTFSSVTAFLLDRRIS